MNKKCIGLLLAIPALMGFGLTSCSNDEPILNQEVSSTKQVEVSFIAELGGASRASLTFDATKNLKFKWEQEDVVYAVNADNGKYLGKLTVSKVLEDPRNCEFKGTLNLPSLGEANLKFYYLGEKGKMEFDSETYLPKDIEVDYSAQTGTAAELDDYDLLKAERAYKSSENGKLGRLSFTRHFSTAQFVLKYNGEELALNGRTVTISAAEGDLYNKASLNYKSGEYTHVPGNITVTPSTNNFYLNLIPTENVKFKFTVTMDNGETFEGTKGGKIAEDTYYSDNLDPIVVEMTHEDGRDNKYDVRVIGNLNYEGSTAEDGKTINTTLPYEYTLVGNLEEPTREGFIFKGWGATAESTEAIATVKFDDKEILEKTVYAIWEKSTYKWTVTWKDGYTENPIKEETYTGTDNYDITGEYPADPKREGYEFAGWSPQISNLTKDDEGQVTITATWKRLATLHLVANFDGANPEEIVIYKEFSNGEAVFDITQDYSTYVGANGAKLPERPGYTFLGWSQDENGKVDTTSVTVSSPNHPNFYVYAVWKKNGSEAVVIAPGAVGSDY